MLSHSFLLKSSTVLAIIVSFILASIKWYVWKKTGSISVQGSLIDSIVDGGASFINFLAITHALSPADEEHRFGHGKIEALAGLVQSILFIFSAFWILSSGFSKVYSATTINYNMLVVLSFTFPITICLIYWQRHVVKKTGSIAVESDALHYQIDFLTDFIACLGVFFVSIPSFQIIDRIMGVGIAIHIFKNSFVIGKRSFDILMDKELSKDIVKAIQEIALSNKNVFNVHGIKTRSSGFKTFAQFHLGLDPRISLEEAHSISDSVEILIKEKFPNMEVIIHQDPFTEDNHEEEVHYNSTSKPPNDI
jgi:ferrous-iron efflux pump FieF